MNRKANNKSRIARYLNEVSVMCALLVVVVASGIGYGVLVNQTVEQVIEREEIEVAMTELGSEITQLELQYIEVQNELTLDYALSHGFLRPTRSTQYVVKAPPALAVAN